MCMYLEWRSYIEVRLTKVKTKKKKVYVLVTVSWKQKTTFKKWYCISRERFKQYHIRALKFRAVPDEKIWGL